MSITQSTHRSDHIEHSSRRSAQDPIAFRSQLPGSLDTCCRQYGIPHAHLLKRWQSLARLLLPGECDMTTSPCVDTTLREALRRRRMPGYFPRKSSKSLWQLFARIEILPFWEILGVRLMMRNQSVVPNRYEDISECGPSEGSYSVVDPICFKT